MSKSCKKEGCSNNSFGGGFCSWHQYLRTDKKRKEIKRTPIKIKIRNTGVAEVFKEILQEREHVSWLTGMAIHNASSYNCAHVVPKGDPEYKALCAKDKDDIILLTNHEHDLFDKGTVDERTLYSEWCADHDIECDWNRLFDLKENLIRKYKQLKSKKNKANGKNY